MIFGKYGHQLLSALGTPLLIFANVYADASETGRHVPVLNAPANHVRPEIVGAIVQPQPKQASKRSPVDLTPRLATAKRHKKTSSSDSKETASNANDVKGMLASSSSTSKTEPSELRSLLKELRGPSSKVKNSDTAIAIEQLIGAEPAKGTPSGETESQVPTPADAERKPADTKPVVSSAQGTEIEVEIEKLLEDDLASPKAPSNGEAIPAERTGDAEPSTPAPRATAPKPFVPSSAVMGLQRPLQRCLALYDHQYVNTQDNACWSTMHCVLAHGNHAKIHVGGFGANTANAVDWLCQNRPCAGRQILFVKDGMLQGRTGPGFQGHDAQLLAILAQIHTPADQPLVVEGQQFTMMDLVRSEQRTCREGAELTFKLIGLLQYLPSDATWESDDGVQWDFPKLIRAELSEKINGAACGGTHRIMAVSHAALKRRYRGEELTGDWRRAEKYMQDYQRYTFSLQNRDGSFSSDWFKKRANWGDADRQLQTTGHILEWLVFSLPDEQLNDPPLVRAVAFLTNLMISNRYHEWEEGPKGHAIRALNLYYQRAFGSRQISNEPRVYRRLPKQRSNSRDSVFTRLRNRFK